LMDHNRQPTWCRQLNSRSHHISSMLLYFRTDHINEMFHAHLRQLSRSTACSMYRHRFWWSDNDPGQAFCLGYYADFAKIHNFVKHAGLLRTKLPEGLAALWGAARALTVPRLWKWLDGKGSILLERQLNFCNRSQEYDPAFMPD